MNMQHVLVTEYGTITLPADMMNYPRRKDGQPDRRFKASRQWHERFRQESDKLRNDYLQWATYE